jgi:hypothetical protein
MAELFGNPDARKRMLQVATDYEQMATTADELAKREYEPASVDKRDRH